MGFLAPLLGEAAGAAGGAGAATAGATGAAGAGGAMTGLAGMGPELATATTPAFSNTTPPTGGPLDWWNRQPQPYRDAVTQGALQNGMNQILTPRALPSPTPMQPGMSMSLPSMTDQPAQPADMSAMAPFIQALAQAQQRSMMNRFGGSPFGFGVPSNYS